MSAILDIPEPLVSVTPSGIFVEWHACGLNVEVRVRETGVYVNIEDARGNFPSYQGDNVGLALSALCALEARK